jgi:ribulose-bisphosphate carboxylase large chain
MSESGEEPRIVARYQLTGREASHPSLLGTYGVAPDSGIGPAVLYGRLPRLAGADISIYPTFGTGYAMTRSDCMAVAEACRAPPAALGRST